MAATLTSVERQVGRGSDVTAAAIKSVNLGPFAGATEAQVQAGGGGGGGHGGGGAAVAPRGQVMRVHRSWPFTVLRARMLPATPATQEGMGGCLDSKHLAAEVVGLDALRARSTVQLYTTGGRIDLRSLCSARRTLYLATCNTHAHSPPTWGLRVVEVRRWRNRNNKSLTLLCGCPVPLQCKGH